MKSAQGELSKKTREVNDMETKMKEERTQMQALQELLGKAKEELDAKTRINNIKQIHYTNNNKQIIFDVIILTLTQTLEEMRKSQEELQGIFLPSLFHLFIYLFYRRSI